MLAAYVAPKYPEYSADTNFMQRYATFHSTGAPWDSAFSLIAGMSQRLNVEELIQNKKSFRTNTTMLWPISTYARFKNGTRRVSMLLAIYQHS